MGRRLSFVAVIPAFNEAENLPRVAVELRECWPDASIVVVDDGSNDETMQVLHDLEARYGIAWLRLHQHLGIGAAMRAGLRFAHLQGSHTVVRIDGDGQHRPSEIARVLAPIVDGEADAVQGSRYAAPDRHPSGLARRATQRLLGRVLSRLTARTVTDPTSGFWAFGPRAVRLLADHHPSGYPEPELLLFLHRNGLRVVEVPVEMRRRLSGRTSLTGARASVALARLLLTTVVAPLRPPVKSSVP
jgi:glycosyltransferase involved in cell wall biosynthesis